MASPFGISPEPGILVKRHDQSTVFLKELIDQSREKYGLLYNGNRHNHVAHGLSAAYQLGCTMDQLKALYSENEKDLMPWNGRKTNRIVSDDDIENHLGDLSYEGDFVTFFESKSRQLRALKQSVLQFWLLERSKPLLAGLIGGYGHPLILLADAVELGSSNLALDALALTAVDWNTMASVVSLPFKNDEIYQPGSLLDVLDRIRRDHTFDGLISGQGIQHIGTILSSPTASVTVIQYYHLGCAYLLQNSDIKNTYITSEIISLAVDLLVATHAPGRPAFDFYLAHNLTFVNCLRILRPACTDGEASHMLIRIYWLLTILAFITQGRPVLSRNLVPDIEGAEKPLKSWDEIKTAALSKRDGLGQRQKDPHFLKAVQILTQLGPGYKDIEPLLLSAANKLVEEFEDWSGFGV